ncbi:cytochrome b N-terminal domain-containing protein [bacterium]|nr:cytochrome b N-terminal domain-containing protein [bacterium]
MGTNNNTSKQTAPGAGQVLRELPQNICKSIFRDETTLEDDMRKSETASDNFFAHILPVDPREHIRFGYTLGLGVISSTLFLIVAATGMLMMFYYVPSTEQAYERIVDLGATVSFGRVVRNIHRWGAHGMVAAVFFHMCRVFFTGAYKPPREFNWVIGVCLLLVTLFFSYTGYLLTWDQLAFWGTTVGTSIAGYAPVLGGVIRFVLLGGDVVGQETLLRFYVLHVFVLPLIMAALLSFHFWRIRKDGLSDQKI